MVVEISDVKMEILVTSSTIITKVKQLELNQFLVGQQLSWEW